MPMTEHAMRIIVAADNAEAVAILDSIQVGHVYMVTERGPDEADFTLTASQELVGVRRRYDEALATIGVLRCEIVQLRAKLLVALQVGGAL